MQRRQLAIRRHFLAGFIVIGLVFGGLLSWSVLAPFEGAVVASGDLAVESNQKAIQHLEGGIVKAIKVREGDRVSAGDVLIRLDGTETRANLAAIETRLMELLAREARLLAERDDRSQPEPRAGFEALTDTDAFARILEGQASLLKARSQSRRKKAEILGERIRQLRMRAEGLAQEAKSKITEVGLVGEELAGLEALFAKQLAPESRILDLKRQRTRLFGEHDALISERSRTQVQIGETRLELEQLLSDHREKVIAELREVTSELSELAERRVAAKDRLKRLDIVAPRSGYAIGVQTHTLGGVIKPGEPVMHIVPDDDRLMARIRISPADIDKIRVGQDARLRFSAFNQRRSPEIETRIVKVSADAMQDEKTGAPYYEVMAEIPHRPAGLPEITLVPGMPVEAMMRTDSRNVLSYLVKPLLDATHRTFRE